MYEKVARKEWFAHSPRTISGLHVKPFVVADSAFPLDPTCLKCYDVVQAPYHRSFNYSLIRTRRVVEQAFGRLKGCWKIMDGQCSLRDPVFARQVAVVCCGLHNICERHQCAFEDGWLPDEGAYINTTPANLHATTVIGSAASVCETIAKFIHRHRLAPQ